jgi:hypothetical protein
MGWMGLFPLAMSIPVFVPADLVPLQYTRVRYRESSSIQRGMPDYPHCSLFFETHLGIVGGFARQLHASLANK